MVYNVSYKTVTDAKPVRIRFDKVDEFVRVYDGTRYLLLFGLEKYIAIFSRIRYLIGEKSGITYAFSHNYATKKADLNDFLPLEQTLPLHNIVILIKSVFNKDQNHYYYNIFLENGSYQLLKHNSNK